MKVLQFTLPVGQSHSIITQEDDLPYFYPYLHRHNEAQLTYIISGEGTLIAGTAMHPFKTGDIFLLGANQPHIFKSDPHYFNPGSEVRAQSLTIFFDPGTTLKPLFNLPEMQLLYNFVQQYTGGFKIPANYREQVLKAMFAIKDLKNADKLINFIQLLQSLYAIKHQLTTLTSITLDKVSDNEGIRIGHIYNYAMQNYGAEITLENIAAEANMTREAFCRYFKKHTGHTFVFFLNQLRINEACKMLSPGNVENIANIAYACGFNSITNFNRTFKTVIGNTPSQYVARYSAGLPGR